MKVISIINQKGGIGKTTTALALSSGLTRAGYKVLTIDLDAQCNLTACTKANAHAENIEDIMFKGAKVQDAIQHLKDFDIIAGSDKMAFVKPETDKFILKKAIEPIKKDYDFIIFDTPPALGSIPINSLTASDIAIIPVQANKMSLQAVSQVNRTILNVIRYTNPNLKIDGILLTRFNGRTLLSRGMLQEFEKVADLLDTRVYKTKIRQNSAIEESQLENMSIFDYAPKSNGAIDYTDFIKEVLEGSEE